jgi:hypothetical protein
VVDPKGAGKGQVVLDGTRDEHRPLLDVYDLRPKRRKTVGVHGIPTKTNPALVRWVEPAKSPEQQRLAAA